MAEDNELAIKIRGVKKTFRVYYDKSNSLKERLIFWDRNRHENRVVLEKILYPDEGTIEVNGRVSSLLELGAGFHPDLSGRENIYNNASIFGLTKKEIDDRLKDIVDFFKLFTMELASSPNHFYDVKDPDEFAAIVAEAEVIGNG